MHDGPTPGATLIYVGSRDAKPWDSRASTKPLDGTPFTRNGFTMYAEIEENVDVQGSFELRQCCEKKKQRDMFETFSPFVLSQAQNTIGHFLILSQSDSQLSEY